MNYTQHKKRSILVSFEEDNDGKYRLSLDDIISEDEIGMYWKKVEHYTSKNYTKKDIQDLKFDEKELADFGYSIMARLYAFMKRSEL